MHDQRRMTFMLLLGIVLGIVLIMSVFFGFSTERLDMSLPATTLLSGNLNETKEAQTRILSITLPREFDEPQSLLFNTTHTMIDVSVGRQTLHTCGHSGKPDFLRSPGAIWHVVDLPEGSAGETLSIFINAVYEDYYGNDPVIRYGSHDACVSYLLISSLPIVLINVIILFVGIFCLILHGMGWLRRNMQARNSFLFVGLFAISITSWSLCQSGFLQFLIPDGPSLYLIDFFSFYMFPACFNLFLASICRGKNEERFCVLAAAYLIESAVSTILQFMGVADMFQLLRIGHLTMAVNVFCVYFFLWQEIVKEQNEMARKLRTPLFVVMVFAASELVTYYLRDFRETSIFIPLGTIVFIIMLACQLISLYYQTILEEEKMAYFKKLANTDMLTEVYNRNAYEDTLKTLEHQEMQLRTTCVVLFDINNMKEINDHYGHESGDLALKTCCRCILQAFGGEGDCYRIGGDEFVYIMHDQSVMAHGAARFGEVVRREAKALHFPFNVAMGYACYDPQKDMALRDVIRRSDKMMYQNKEEQKRKDQAFAGVSMEKAAQGQFAD